MQNPELIQRLKDVIAQFLSVQQLELIDLTFRFEAGQQVLRVLVDRPEGGITMGECAGLNRSIAGLLDEQELIQQRYVLEVSSPGLDRPLATKSDFGRCLNRPVKFFLIEPINGKIELDGVVSGVSEGAVEVLVSTGIISIPLAAIRKARQMV